MIIKTVNIKICETTTIYKLLHWTKIFIIVIMPDYYFIAQLGDPITYED